jgi:6-pyruvoyltetrahydropterin/6-carboxytetrahydropterin synthase
MNYKLYLRGEFAAAHQLKRHPGKCRNLHGHNWLVEVFAYTSTLNDQNMVIDFGRVKEIVMQLDHTYLNDKLDEEQPTSEFIAGWIADKIKKEGVEKVIVRIWEDQNSYIEVIR